MPRLGPAGVLSHPQYRRFWIAGLLSFTAFWVQVTTRSWMVQEMTGSPFLVSLIPVAMTLPMLFLSLAGGLIADRFDRKRIIVAAETAAAVGYVALALLVVAGVAQVWHILALSGLTGVGMAIAAPARLALAPSLVPRSLIRPAVGLSTVVFNLAQIAGPAVAGVLIARTGTEASLFLSLLLSAPAWFLYLSVRSGQGKTPGRPAGSPVENAKAGIVYVLRDHSLRWLFVSAFVVVTLIAPWSALLPTYVGGVLDMGAEALGILTLSTGVGALAGSLIVVAIGGRVASHRVEAAAVAAVVIALAGFALSPWFPLSALMAGLVGMALTAFFVNNMTVIQLGVPDELRGRVMSVRFLVMGAAPVGTIVLGALAEGVGPRLALAAFAAAGAMAFGALRVLSVGRRAAAAEASARVAGGVRSGAGG